MSEMASPYCSSWLPMAAMISAYSSTGMPIWRSRSRAISAEAMP